MSRPIPAGCARAPVRDAGEALSTVHLLVRTTLGLWNRFRAPTGRLRVLFDVDCYAVGVADHAADEPR